MPIKISRLSKEFHISTVGSVVFERIVSNQNEAGLFEILEFMNYGHLPTDMKRFGALWKKCKSDLLYQFPQFGTPEMKKAVADMERICQGKSSPDDIKRDVNIWFSNVASGRYPGIRIDELLLVKQLPSE